MIPTYEILRIFNMPSYKRMNILRYGFSKKNIFQKIKNLKIRLETE